MSGGNFLRHDHADGGPADGARPVAARRQVDGAGAWQRFWHVTFPHLRGVSTVTILLLTVANFNSFIIPWIMTGGGPANASHIWITHIYELAFGRQRWGVAAAYSVLLFIILMTLGYFYVRALTAASERRRRHDHDRRQPLAADRRRKRDRRLALGRPRLPRCSCCSSPPCRWPGCC